MLFLLIQLDLITQIVYLAIHTNTHITRMAHLLKDTFVLAFAPCNKWSKQHDARTFWQIENRIYNLLYSLPAYLTSTFRAMWMSSTRVEQAHIVVNLGNSPNSRTRIMRSAFLINRYSW